MWENLADILRECARSPLALIALFMLVMSFVALRLFRGARTRVKVLVFLVLLLSSLGLLSYVVISKATLVQERASHISSLSRVDPSVRIVRAEPPQNQRRA